MRFLSSHRVLVPAAVVTVSLALGMVYGAASGQRDGACAAVALGVASDPASLTSTTDPRDEAAGCRAVTYPSGDGSVDAYLCLPVADGPAPAVVVVHETEGPQLEGDAYQQIARGLAAAGYVALQVDYFSQTPLPDPLGVAPASVYAADWPVWLREIGDAVTYLQTLSDVDPERIGLNGYSLGAVLSLTQAQFDPRSRP